MLLFYPEKYDLKVPPLNSFWIASKSTRSLKQMVDEYSNICDIDVPKIILYNLIHDLYGPGEVNEPHFHVLHHLEINPKYLYSEE